MGTGKPCPYNDRIEIMYNPNKHDRRAMRLKGYDYSLPGMYFVTICVQERECLLGYITGGIFNPSKFGHIANNFWNQVPQHFSEVSIDCFTIMPNHVHALIQIHEAIQVNNQGGISISQPRPNLGAIVAYYKYQTTSQINEIRNMPGVRFWQQRFYDHIVRNECELDAIRHYIVNNHLKWEEDQENPRNWETSKKNVGTGFPRPD